MTIYSVDNIAAQLPSGSRLLGLDLGTKTIGLAISDSSYRLATPLETIRRKKFTLDAEKLLSVIDARTVGGLVLGLPINMDGTEGPRCQSTRQFAQNLLEKRDIPLAFWDERLSTVAVERDLIEADVSRAKRADVIDELAASYILQGALDYMSRNNR